MCPPELKVELMKRAGEGVVLETEKGEEMEERKCVDGTGETEALEDDAGDAAAAAGDACPGAGISS